MTRPKQQMSGLEDMLTMRDLACLSGLSEHLLRRLVELDVLEPDSDEPAICFRTQVLHHIRRVRRLHVDLGVGWASMPLVLQLMNRIEELETALEQGSRRAEP